ncbi:hypothetical protein LSM04_004106 [Trypanosoma melophagium]|uniref:uncharacterized protein n=1 Tax=Trypanosoma melophagium TaxID=715481 RepID=UPI00351A7947|nr:hypothetical protein LSM04_004106 [Trypanosoma melophagium]
MTGLGEILASRLALQDERSRLQRQLFEDHRRWLISELVSLSPNKNNSSHNENDDALKKRSLQEREKSQMSSQNVRGIKHGSSVPVQDRLMEYGRQRLERMQKARQIRQEEEESEEQKILKASEAHLHKRTYVPLAVNTEELSRIRARRHERITEQSVGELNFHPRISVESARLAHERKVRENTEAMPIADTLLYRKASADGRLETKRSESNIIRASPMITRKAKKMKLPYTAAERLYLHAKERQSEEKAMEEKLHDIIEENLELTFHPLISEKADKLQRKPGRRAYDDLYEHGLEQQRQKRLTSNEDNKDCFKPSINRVSDLIATQMNESTTERLLKPRQVKRAATPSPQVQMRSEYIDRRFGHLYLDGVARSARQRNLLLRQQQMDSELHSEYTFAPKINRNCVSSSSAVTLPLDVRMRLWQERRDQRLNAARKVKEEEKREIEFGGIGASTTSRHRVPSVSKKFSATFNTTSPTSTPTRRATSGYDRSDSFLIECKTRPNMTALSSSTQLGEHQDTILKALQALENAERVSQYIMIDGVS